MKPHTQEQRSGRMRLPVWAAVCVFLAVSVFFLWAEHEAHIMGALPYALVFLCVAMHFFMHGGHGGHGGGSGEGGR